MQSFHGYKKKFKKKQEELDCKDIQNYIYAMNQSCFLFFILLLNFSKEKRKKYPQIYLRRDGGNVFSCQLLYNGVEKES